MHKLIEQIKQFLNRGESVQVVAPPGFGKSRVGKALGGFLIDPNLLQTPQEMLAAIKQSSERKLIIIDGLHKIISDDYRPLFQFLKGLRDTHKYQLAYVFLVNRAIGYQYQQLLGDLYEIITEHIVDLDPLEPSEYDLFGFTPTPTQLTQIKKLSGGIPALVKICVMGLRDNISLEPDHNPKLKAQLEEIITACPKHSSYPNSQLIINYLKQRSSTQLTASETRLMNLFLSHQNEIVSKDQICQAVYPDVKNYAGISDHSIDQLIHRLRSKIKDKYTLTTHRGLGYKLTN